jgi:hypothetical protein
MRMSRYFILASIVLASRARSEPPGLEVAVATWLLHHSVPEKERTVANPIGSDGADNEHCNRYEQVRSFPTGHFHQPRGW